MVSLILGAILGKKSPAGGTSKRGVAGTVNDMIAHSRHQEFGKY